MRLLARAAGIPFIRKVADVAIRPFPGLKRRILSVLTTDTAGLALRGYADRRARPATFVQIGSNDAYYGDPLRPLVESRGWRGLCVEPVPWIFARLVENYAEFDGMQFAAVGVGPKEGTATFFCIGDKRPGDPGMVSRVGSFHRDHLLKFSHQIADLNARIEPHDVRVVTYQHLIDDFQIDPDVVHVDAEGMDSAVVRQVLSCRPLPEALLFEHIHLQPADRTSLATELQEAGYLLTAGHTDTFAIRASTAR